MLTVNGWFDGGGGGGGKLGVWVNGCSFHRNALRGVGKEFCPRNILTFLENIERRSPISQPSLKRQMAPAMALTLEYLVVVST